MAKDHQSILVARIKDIVSSGRIQKMTHSAIHARCLAAFDSMPKRMPQFERTYARGYMYALLDALWTDAEFCYRDANGTLFSTWRESVHRKTEEFYSSDRGAELALLECAHVWRGTDKPFTDWTTHSAMTQRAQKAE